jgi:hypothetical protein
VCKDVDAVGSPCFESAIRPTYQVDGNMSTICSNSALVVLEIAGMCEFMRL